MIKTQSTDLPFVGRASIIDFLEQSVRHKQSFHAYCVYGPNGSGKEELVRYFAQMLLCHAKDGALPCGVCASCVHFMKKLHPDLVEIRKSEDEKNIGIEAMREAQRQMSLHPSFGERHVVIVYDAQDLSHEAQNSVLKFLEEPPASTVVLFVTSHVSSLLPTVRSRLLPIKLSLLRPDIVSAFLRKNHPNLSGDDIRFISEISAGRMKEAEALTSDSNALRQSREKYRSALQFLLQPTGERLTTIRTAFGKKASFMEQQVVARDFCYVMLFVLWKGVIGGLQINEPVAGISKLCEKFPASVLEQKMQRIVEILEKLKQNVQPRLLLEQFAWE